MVAHGIIEAKKIVLSIRCLPDDLASSLIETKRRKCWDHGLSHVAENLTNSMIPFSGMKKVTLEDHFAEMSLTYTLEEGLEHREDVIYTFFK